MNAIEVYEEEGYNDYWFRQGCPYEKETLYCALWWIGYRQGERECDDMMNKLEIAFKEVGYVKNEPNRTD